MRSAQPPLITTKVHSSFRFTLNLWNRTGVELALSSATAVLSAAHEEAELFIRPQFRVGNDVSGSIVQSWS